MRRRRAIRFVVPKNKTGVPFYGHTRMSLTGAYWTLMR